MFLAAACAWPDRPAAAHDFHASLTQIEVNSSAKTVEIAIRVFVDDLEDALSRRAGRRVQLGTTSGFDALALAYVSAGLRIETAGGELLPLEWVGKESTVDIVWLYVEAPIREGLDNVKLHDTLFFELFEDQVNTVNVRDGKRRATLTFSPGDGAKTIDLNP